MMGSIEAMPQIVNATWDTIRNVKLSALVPLVCHLAHYKKAPTFAIRRDCSDRRPSEEERL